MISAIDIATALRIPRPTDQQVAVIEAPLEPALVVAGAGSGKTETMAGRVLWLLANGHVTADQVLGLTFTRKASGELGSRIRERIAQLTARGLVAGEPDPFALPMVATYNSFANSIFREHAILIGREGDGVVLGEAAAWQLARALVVSSTDARLLELGRSVDALTTDLLTLSRALSENIADPASVVALAERFRAVVELPPGGSGAYAEVDSLVAKVGSLPLLVDLSSRYAAVKTTRGFVEYSDQVALALEIVRTVPSVRADFRDRYRVVLLDEYQDTSVVQTWLLAQLFAGHPVMAVGDPNQSIYGWRGASASNLGLFADQFGVGDGDRPVRATRSFSLSTSWRNGHRILAVANALVEPLTAGSLVPVEMLAASPSASSIAVEVTFEETLRDEADAVATWLKRKLATVPGEASPSAAILFRARKTQGAFVEALRRHGVPYHVLGVGGLMAEPEIADLVCALTVVSDPSAGSELVRLLSGAHWRIGVRDLATLRRVSSWLASRDHAQQPLDVELRALLRASVADGENGSIVDALDFVATAGPGHVALEGFSATGLERLRDAGRLFARLRARTGLDLLDFVTFVEQELWLDIEVVANDTNQFGGAAMDAFVDALSGYLAIDESGSLSGFLSWLREAEWRDSLAPRPEEPEPGTVQLMTIHGAKGLERDVVVVPRMVEGELPAVPNEGHVGWLTHGALPYEFRGDAGGLPVFQWEGARTRKELLSARTEFVAAVRRRHEIEELRLAYVAVTRARHSLLLTGSFWAGQKRPRLPSPVLLPLAESGTIGPLPSASAFDADPLGDEQSVMSWPLDPLGGRRPAVERAAALVRAAQPGADGTWAEGTWATDLTLLLEERRRRLEGGVLIELPRRVAASRFKDYVGDPQSVAASLRRPMPERPYGATRLGTQFHSWVEQRFGVGGSSEIIDAWVTEQDAGEPPVAHDELEWLKRVFERSPWAGLKPVDVEREIHLPFDGQVIVCKIDAVYLENDRYQIVDWKTGAPPRNAAELEQKQLQLALYRLAYATWKGIDPSLIDAVFYFVGADRVIAPERILGEAELLERWRSALPAERAEAAGNGRRAPGDRGR